LLWFQAWFIIPFPDVPGHRIFFSYPSLFLNLRELSMMITVPGSNNAPICSQRSWIPLPSRNTLWMMVRNLFDGTVEVIEALGSYNCSLT